MILVKNQLPKIDVKDCINEMLEKFTEEINGSARTPWNDKLFKTKENTEQLCEMK